MLSLTIMFGDEIGTDLIYNIIFTLFGWLFLSIVFFLFRYFRHLRQERNRFLTLEPDFQELNERYHGENGESATVFHRVVQWLEGTSGNKELKLKLSSKIGDYKSCVNCGAITYKYELKCEICASIEFDLITK